MERTIKRFYKDMKKTRKYCPWAKEQSLKNFLDELKSEIEEAKIAIKNNDEENLKEELGDIFCDTLFLMIIANEEGYDIREIIKNANKKQRRRKPFVFKTPPKKVTLDEARKIWKDAKQKEKEDKK